MRTREMRESPFIAPGGPKANRRVSTRGWCPQDLFCPRLIPMHLRYERGDGIEFRLGPDPSNEENLDRLAVKIAGKIEEKGFEQRPAIIERRAAAVTRHAVIGFGPGNDADGVDAVAQPAARVRQ